MTLPAYVPNQGPTAARKLRNLLPTIDTQIATAEAALASLDRSLAKGLAELDEQTALRARLDALAAQNRKRC